MRKNLELKAVYPSVRSAQSVCRQIKAANKGVLRQTDTYFNVKGARLKLREINGNQFELIFYRRKNLRSSRYSNFIVVPMAEPAPAREVFQKLYGIRAVVQKKRLLYLYKNARIHIDSVLRLGVFLEFEVLVNRGTKQARDLMRLLTSMFGISSESIIAGSYSDMMVENKLRSSAVARRKKALAQPG